MDLTIRVDATSAIGFGHLVRCLALAQHWKGNVHFVSHCDAPDASTSIRAQGFEFNALSDPTLAGAELARVVARCSSPVAVVFDGYQYTGADHRHAASLGCAVVVIDDNAHQPEYFADVLVNQNLYARSLRYSVPSHCRLLLGTEYAMLRREFASMRSRNRKAGSPPTVLITMGGSDAANITARILDACKQVAGINVIVVAGAANRRVDDLRRTIANDPRFRLEHAVSDMAGLLSQADLVITAAGTTCWECCCMGLPMVTVIAADNQCRNAESLAAAGAAISLGWHDRIMPGFVARQIAGLLADPAALHRMANVAGELVDGRGATRVAVAIEQRVGAARGTA